MIHNKRWWYIVVSRAWNGMEWNGIWNGMETIFDGWNGMETKFAEWNKHPPLWNGMEYGNIFRFHSIPFFHHFFQQNPGRRTVWQRQPASGIYMIHALGNPSFFRSDATTWIHDTVQPTLHWTAEWTKCSFIYTLIITEISSRWCKSGGALQTGWSIRGWFNTCAASRRRHVSTVRAQISVFEFEAPSRL